MGKKLHPLILWDVITRGCHNFNGDLHIPPLKLEHGFVIALHSM